MSTLPAVTLSLVVLFVVEIIGLHRWHQRLCANPAMQNVVPKRIVEALTLWHRLILLAPGARVGWCSVARRPAAQLVLLIAIGLALVEASLASVRDFALRILDERS